MRKYLCAVSFFLLCMLFVPTEVKAGESFCMAQGTRLGEDLNSSKVKKPKIKKAQSKKKEQITLTWQKISNADRYEVWYSKKYNGTYTRLKTIKNPSTVTYTHKKLTNGTCYFYKLIARRKIKGRWYSNTSDIYWAYCSYYGYKDESYWDRAKRIFGKIYYDDYASAKEAEKNMKTIKVKVWDLSGGSWYTRIYSIKVNKNIASTVAQMFDELYKVKKKDRIPIHALGCYSWRGNSSEHDEGLAIDINWEENYMIDDGKVLAGSFWNPKKSKYSIPLKCKLVKIFEKYGFSRGFWGDRKDYMHFSYFGT